MRPALLRDLGRRAYEPVWRAMQAFTDARDADTADELWLVEHDPVFTLGQAGRPEHVLMPGDIPVLHVDRGGQVTYHGPGQIVLYPLLDLRLPNFILTPHVAWASDGAMQFLADQLIDNVEAYVKGSPVNTVT